MLGQQRVTARIKISPKAVVGTKNPHESCNQECFPFAAVETEPRVHRERAHVVEGEGKLFRD